MINQKFFLSLSVLITSLSVFMFACMSPDVDKDINLSVRKAYLSTCKISVDDLRNSKRQFFSTGVLLNTG